MFGTKKNSEFPKSRKSKNDECEWDIIRNICEKAIKRNWITKEQVCINAKKLLKEVRTEKET